MLAHINSMEMTVMDSQEDLFPRASLRFARHVQPLGPAAFAVVDTCSISKKGARQEGCDGPWSVRSACDRGVKQH
jgi:hypothetical protein